MSAAPAVVGFEALRLARRPWVQAALAAGVAWAVAVIAVAATHDGVAREDSLRSGGAGLLLLGGLLVACLLGATALNRDGDNGHMGALLGGGASRPLLTLGALAARTLWLLGILAAWTVALQVGSLALGLGLDGPLAVHAAATAEGLVLTLLAAAAASSIVQVPFAAIFGLLVYVAAQAAVNLKAAADVHLIGSAADTLVNSFYYLGPRVVTSPMIADLQLRDTAGAAAPRIDINGAEVHVPAADWGTPVWTAVWLGLFVVLCLAGMRRRPIL
ncbi:MAG: hypothetical protein AB7V42_14990 [Thermoleophilia bacterium]